MLALLKGNELVAIGILDLAIAATIFVLVKERIILRNSEEFAELVTSSILRNVALISCGLILIGLIFN